MTSTTRHKCATAGDMMTRNVVTVNQDLPAIDAAELLMTRGLSGAPVVDADNRCVGVFSATDFIRIVKSLSHIEEQPQCCPFQLRHRRQDGSEVTLCTLPSGMCPMRMAEQEGDEIRHICQSPQEIVVEWQSLQPQLSPNDPVKRWMSALPITIEAKATITECARRMARARIHRLVIVDGENHVVGLVSSMDLLNAIANAPSE